MLNILAGNKRSIYDQIDINLDLAEDGELTESEISKIMDQFNIKDKEQVYSLYETYCMFDLDGNRKIELDEFSGLIEFLGLSGTEGYTK